MNASSATGISNNGSGFVPSGGTYIEVPSGVSLGLVIILSLPVGESPQLKFLNPDGDGAELNCEAVVVDFDVGAGVLMLTLIIIPMMPVTKMQQMRIF
jgi:hypothetical protein